MWSLRKVSESNVTLDRLRFMLQLGSLETLKLCAKMTFKEAIEKQKTLQCSVCIKKNTVSILLENLFSERETKFFLIGIHSMQG